MRPRALPLTRATRFACSGRNCLISIGVRWVSLSLPILTMLCLTRAMSLQYSRTGIELDRADARPDSLTHATRFVRSPGLSSDDHLFCRLDRRTRMPMQVLWPVTGAVQRRPGRTLGAILVLSGDAAGRDDANWARPAAVGGAPAGGAALGAVAGGPVTGAVLHSTATTPGRTLGAILVLSGDAAGCTGRRRRARGGRRGAGHRGGAALYSNDARP